MAKPNLKSDPSYHSSMANLLYVPGVGHVAPDTYSEYGSLLDSDVDDGSVVKSQFIGPSDTVVPDSLPEELRDLGGKSDKSAEADDDHNPLFVESPRSGPALPNTRAFNRFCRRYLEKMKKKAEKKEEDEGAVIGKPVEKCDDFSSKSPKIDIYCAWCLKQWKNEG